MPSVYRSKWDFNAPKRLTVFSREFEEHVKEFKEAVRSLGLHIQHAETSLGGRSDRVYMSMRVDKSELQLVIDYLRPGRLPKSKKIIGLEKILNILREITVNKVVPTPDSLEN